MNALALLLSMAIGAPPERAVDFDTEIIPVFTKAGCNAGACHGAAAGRGDFRLSLFGADPATDYATIVQEFEGRRINYVRPEASLLIAKPTGQLSHGGEMALEPDGAGAERILQWIRQGAPRYDARHLVEFHVEPTTVRVAAVGAEVALRAEATFSDGSHENVTDWTVFTSNDPGSVEMDAKSAQARLLRPGKHVIIARYLECIVPLSLTLPYQDVESLVHADPGSNWIDEDVLRLLKELRITPSPRVDDAGFLRRVTLDLTGRLPEVETVRAFLADAAPEKRMVAVDRLLESDAFVEYWTFRLCGWLGARTFPNEPEAYTTYRAWIAEQLRADASWNDTARQLVLAVGDSHTVGPANFARTAGDARGQAELVSRAFLGVRLQCANCHRHPLDQWTQDDYHGLAGIFARLDRGQIVRIQARGAVTNPRTAEPARPRIPGFADLDPQSDGRVAFADWMTAPENPYFARAMANRLWAAMFGRGLIEPVDDLRATNPATHPELLSRLASDFAAHGYRLRHTLRLLALSDAYQRGAATEKNAFDDRYYSHALARPLEPELLVDAIVDVTGVPERTPGIPPGTRSIAIPPGTTAPSLTALGKCSQQEVCGSNASGGGLPARLHLLNGRLLNAKLAGDDGALHERIRAGASNEAIIEEFYVRACGRLPSVAEREYWMPALPVNHSAERTAVCEDFVWSLLSSREFTTNH